VYTSEAIRFTEMDAYLQGAQYIQPKNDYCRSSKFLESLNLQTNNMKIRMKIDISSP